MPPLSLIKGKPYKVKDDDTLKSIAEKAGITWQELARFNWGTDNPDRINAFLRNKVGCRKRTSDGKNYIFTSKDDPGIIQVPEKMPEKSFASNATHPIIVSPGDPKTRVPSKCMVHFRPASDWKGKFGFDWLRIGDRGAEKYEPPLLTGGFGLTAAKAKEEIKKEFPKLETEVKGKPDYRVPYLNLFPPNSKESASPGDPQPPSEAKLDLLVTIEDQAAESLKFRVGNLQDNDDLSGDLVIPDNDKYFDFELVGGTTIPASVGSHKATVKIKCLKKLDADVEINIYALTREPAGDLKAYVAGKIIAGANGASSRKKIKFILVPVWTDVRGTGVAIKGSFTNKESENLRNALFQAMIEGELLEVPGLYLDLADNDDFKKTTSAGAKGRYYTTKKKGGLNQDDNTFFDSVKTIFLSEGDNDKYKDYFTIFTFGERPYDFALGQVQDFNVHNLIVFPKRDDCTVNHEGCHGLGLNHSFKEDPPEPGAKFTFEEGKTDNVMDYTYDSSALILWRWQWQIINK